jgi:hypothetical protein
MFKRYALPSLLILALAGGYAMAQTINRALQLSQDTSGAFSIDTNNGIYFPNHIFSTGRTPTITGTGTPLIRGTDSAGQITMGSSGQTAIAVFGRAFLTTPYCVVSTNVTMLSPLWVTTLLTSFTVNQVATSGNLVNYICLSSS